MTTATPTDHPGAALALRLLDAFATGDEAAARDVLHPDVVDHAPTTDGHGPDAVVDSLRWVRSVFADAEELVEDVIATDDRVVVRSRFAATHVGELEGLPATGRRFRTEHLHVWRVQDGLLAEHWMFRDDLAMLRQLGTGR